MKMNSIRRRRPSLIVWSAPIIAMLALATAAAPSEAAAARKPNVVIILADDLGYAEITCDGKQPIPTPRVASIARHGVCCPAGYVSCPVCSPTRAGLMTGRYQQRFGHEFNPGPAALANKNFGLPLQERTLADRLKKVGYATGLVGKWHLGYESPYHPLRRGFDEFFGFLGGAHSYVDSSADATNPIRRGEQPIDEPAYLTDAIGREAVAFVDRHKAEPFFLYMAFNAVHAPLQATPKYSERFSDVSDSRRRTFSAMLSALDDSVGLLLDKLAAEKLEGDTLIFFISDNGGPTRQTTSRNDPLRGFKGQVWEGGVRVPFAVQWKGHLPEGKIYAEPVISLDVVPTALAAAGAGRRQRQARRRRPAAISERQEQRPATRHAVLAIRPPMGHPQRRFQALATARGRRAVIRPGRRRQRNQRPVGRQAGGRRTPDEAIRRLEQPIGRAALESQPPWRRQSQGGRQGQSRQKEAAATSHVANPRSASPVRKPRDGHASP